MTVKEEIFLSFGQLHKGTAVPLSYNISQRNAYKTRLEQADIITKQIEGPFLTYADAIKEGRFSEKLNPFDKFIDHK